MKLQETFATRCEAPRSILQPSHEPGLYVIIVCEGQLQERRIGLLS